MKKMVIICICLCLLLGAAFPVSAQQVSESSNVETTEAVTPAPQINYDFGIDSESTFLGTTKLADNVRSAIIFESNSQTLMYGWEADKQMYPASLVKLLTAYIAIEMGNLQDVVVVSQDAVSSVPQGAVSADLLPGEELTLEDLLYCMLLGSANDAASVIAEHIAGNQAAFVELLNQYATEIGCTGSNFTNAHGLHNEQQYTTARDVARILSIAIKNDTFRTVFTATKYTVSATNKSEERSLLSSNYLLDQESKLYFDERVIGGRTGVTDDGRRCLAAVAEANGMQLIGVVMGADSEYLEDGYSAVRIGGYKEIVQLFDAGFTGYQTAQILYENQALRQFAVSEGTCDVIVGPKSSVKTVLPDGVQLSQLTFQYSNADFHAPIKQGDQITSITVWHQNMCIAQVDLFAMNDVAVVQNHTQVDESQQKDQFPVVLFVALAVLALAVLAVFLIRLFRWIQHVRLQKRSKQYRRSHRRSR